MDRLIHQQLRTWFQNKSRKPLILKGARQVGKTYAVNYFGRDFLEKNGGRFFSIDLKAEKELHKIFQDTQNPQKIIEQLELKKNIKIDATRDLLFIDEIQECPEAIGSLKYFEKDLNSLAIIAAGSHLGLIKNEASFPVGKVNFMAMFPMTFFEFILAVEKKWAPYIENFDASKCEKIPESVHEALLEYFFIYLAVGGLPEVVAKFCALRTTNMNQALTEARVIQKELLTGYQADFSKYSGTVNANHIQYVFESIPTQLSKSFDESIAKFKFSDVIPKQKGFERIIGPLTWLRKSRLCIKSLIAKSSGHPLISYTEQNAFKVFFFDVGLLNAALNTPMNAIVQNNLSSYKGYLVENFVAQELFAKLDEDLISWTEGQSEIEFLVSKEELIIPIEVKAAQRSRKSKSLDVYVKRYSPKLAYKVTGQNAGPGLRGFATIPLYVVAKILD